MRDVILVLAAALLLRSCEPSAGFDAGSAPAAPSVAPAALLASAGPLDGVWRRDDLDGGPLLLFAQGSDPPMAVIGCAGAPGTLVIERMTVKPSGGIGSMTVTVDSRSRTLPVEWEDAEPPIAVAALALDDRIVDGLARISGRIALELDGEPRLVLPADRKIGALIDECRARI